MLRASTRSCRRARPPSVRTRVSPRLFLARRVARLFSSAPLMHARLFSKTLHHALRKRGRSRVCHQSQLRPCRPFQEWVKQTTAPLQHSLPLPRAHAPPAAPPPPPPPPPPTPLSPPPPRPARCATPPPPQLNNAATSRPLLFARR